MQGRYREAIALDLEPYDGARVHGHTMSVADIARVVTRVASVPLAERSRIRGLEPKRRLPASGAEADRERRIGKAVLELVDALREVSRCN